MPQLELIDSDYHLLQYEMHIETFLASLWLLYLEPHLLLVAL